MISLYRSVPLSRGIFPRRVLFDTNLVNLTLDHGEFVFDGGIICGRHPSHTIRDLDALRALFELGRRGGWELAVSPITYGEIMRTPDPYRRENLSRWFGDLWAYWRQIFGAVNLSDAHTDALARRLVNSKLLSVLPDEADRILVVHAIAYGCDTFCTRDFKTILRHRNRLTMLGLQFFSPAEWLRSLP